MERNPIIIETNRLLLQGLSPQDMTFIFGNYAKDEIKKILGHQTDEEYKKEAYKQENGYVSYNRSFILFLLKDKVSDNIIGRCILHNWYAEHNRAELGYNMTDERFKHQGFMTEAVSAVIDYGFNTMKLHRIEALVGSDNIPSLKIMAHHNFIQEGVLRQHYYILGKYEDSVVFSKLYSEYMDEKRGMSR